MNDWERKPDGDLKLSVLVAYDMAAGEGEAVALRIQHAVVQEQLDGDMIPHHVQLVMSAEAAAELGKDLTAAALAATEAGGAA